MQRESRAVIMQNSKQIVFAEAVSYYCMECEQAARDEIRQKLKEERICDFRFYLDQCL